MKRQALQNKKVGVLRMAFRARKVFGTFEKRAPWTKTGSERFVSIGLSKIFKLIVSTSEKILKT